MSERNEGKDTSREPEKRPGRLVLDSSALLALIEGASGAETVAAALRRSSSIIPWPALVEVYYVSVQRAGVDEADRRHAMLSVSDAEIRWDADEQLALTAARIKAGHRVAHADALIAAYAIREQATLLHRDPDFESIEGLSHEALPYRR